MTFRVELLPINTVTVVSVELKPGAETRVLYFPGGSAPELNVPDGFVLRSTTCPVAMFVIVTLASLITAAVGSLIVPTMLPVSRVIWAKSGTTIFTKQRSARSGRVVAPALMATKTMAGDQPAGADP